MRAHLLSSTFDREGIMQALWGDPIARITCRDIPARLRRGDEYVDLQNLEAGVQRARRTMSPTGGELARRAVRPDTWEKLLAYLEPVARAAQ